MAPVDQLDAGRFGGHQFGPEALRLSPHLAHQQRALHALRKTWVVLDLRRQHQLPAGLVPGGGGFTLEDQWLKICPGAVQRGRLASRPRTYDHDFPSTVLHVIHTFHACCSTHMLPRIFRSRKPKHGLVVESTCLSPGASSPPADAYTALTPCPPSFGGSGGRRQPGTANHQARRTLARHVVPAGGPGHRRPTSGPGPAPPAREPSPRQ